MLGVIAGQTGRKADALHFLRQAAELQPAHPELQKNLGIALTDAGHAGEAIAAFRRAIALKPDYAEAHRHLGMMLHRERQFSEAAAAYREALRIIPNFPGVAHHLGLALRALGRNEDAATAFRDAVRARPDHAEAFAHLGHTLRDLGHTDDALAAYREALRLKPGLADVQHVVAALTGDRSVTATPPDFVRHLFDSYAADFDEHLTENLGYRIPGIMFDAVLAAAPGRQFDILDLGCGTGLCGVHFRSVARSLTGVDLSTTMLARAEARGLYDRLLNADITAAMESGVEQFDLILAADVFAYVGDLRGVFTAATRALRKGGLLTFSLERHDGDGFLLHHKIRFAHSLGYVRGLARASALTELHASEVTIRRSGADTVPGWLIVLQKPAS